MPATIVLASASPTRIRLLRDAGLAFDAEGAEIDERALEAPLVEAETSGPDLALALAEAKAMAVAARHPESIVVGADQVMEHDGGFGHKAGSRQEAARQLAELSGKVHWLHTAAVLVTGGTVAWHHMATARLAMRERTAAEIDAYLDEIGDDALATVGTYQIEGPGIRLFDDIHGDYFAILGLPLLPLLKALREAGATV